MKRALKYIAVVLLIIGLLYLAYRWTGVVVNEPTRAPGEIRPPAPLVPNPFRPDDILVADAAGELEQVSVEGGQDVGATATITDTTGEGSDWHVQLALDAVEARWFPDVSLERRASTVRTIGEAPGTRVDYVQQRMPVFGLEFKPFAGAAVATDYNAGVVAGAHVLRAWFVHVGPGVAASRDRITPGVHAGVQLRDNLMIGTLVGPDYTRPWITVSYQF